MHDQPIIIKKKKSHGHKHHGGSWKVAYADFVTAMMAFFMVMWILGMSPQDKSIIASYFKDPISFAKADAASKVSIINFPGSPPTMRTDGKTEKEGADPRKDDEAKMRQIQGQIKDALGGIPDVKKLLDQVEVTLVREGLRIELLEKEHSTFFDSGQASLKPEGRKLVAKLAPLIGNSGRKVIIEGHTDAMPYPGGTYNNFDLSTDRARTVRRALCLGGVQQTQLAGDHGYGDTRLRDPKNPYSSANRRVTILLPFRDENQMTLPKDALKHEIDEAFEKPKPSNFSL